MRRMLLVSCLVILATVPAVAQKVKSGYDKKVDFAKYKTYVFGAGLPAARAEINQQILANMEQELATRGLKKVEEAVNADIEVSYFGGIGSPMVVPLRSEFYPPTWLGYWGASMANQADPVLTGEALFEIRDLKSMHLVWEAYVTQNVGDSVLKNPKKVSETVEKMVAKAFKSYPSKK